MEEISAQNTYFHSDPGGNDVVFSFFRLAIRLAKATFLRPGLACGPEHQACKYHIYHQMKSYRYYIIFYLIIKPTIKRAWNGSIMSRDGREIT